MASPSFHLDDDEFDWDAAVREIDSACEAAPASTSNRDDFARSIPAAPKPGGKARQSTLDRFIGGSSFGKRKNEGDHDRRSGVLETPTFDQGFKHNLGVSDEAVGVEIDLEAAQTWIYPVNIPLRKYQCSIAKTALLSNTLVALPTGLGKTLIAAVVMYNYFRWFPEGKIVFTAPSRPLVMQQIEACHNIVGIPQEWAIDMTGQMSPPKRSRFWTTKRVFFVTPQVLEKDIQSGICLVKQLVCLVIDEAHRATGNYAYCVAVRELLAVPVHLRILALTATPGSKHKTVQSVIDNLCISTLEYRDESDPDVSPYVHNRKIELIEVEMSKEATEIYNLLLEAIKPLVTRLSAMGVLNRDPATLSPCELLNLREKFRQAPPPCLPHYKHGEIESYFSALITLYHIRKLLSSHGIRPALEMLDEKLRQGSLARHMSRSEAIHRAKLLMQQSLSHGAPSPKLAKMLEILKDHFRAKDPKDSRVIIFSNFRGSVRDIMDSLSSISDLVKATEFIGQSSGKTLKGQTQKVQQAVLQKFRTGGYNVIVATSIGEEGLDIMEVDLVICFDANISPLRMIQRMGRTGRKHDGRVVVLACTGTELTGYLKKQGSSRAIRKHMHNGGTRSFDFYPSPRMVPHICQPEVQYVELSIEQFIPRGRKVKDSTTQRSPVPKRISDKEKDLIARYFNPSKQDIWKPSLIAFPIFQAFPCRVHNVRHSFKTTTMFIDAMQCLQGLSFSKAKKTDSFAEFETSNRSLQDVPAAVENNEQDSSYGYGVMHIVQEEAETSNAVVSLKETSKTVDEFHMPDSHPFQKPSAHCFFFGEDFVTVNTSGSVLIASVPVFHDKGFQVTKLVPTDGNKELLGKIGNDAFSFKASAVHFGKLNMQVEDAAKAEVSNELKCVETAEILASPLPKSRAQNDDEDKEAMLQTPDHKVLMDSEDCWSEKPCRAGTGLAGSSVSKSRRTVEDMELSPRLTHFVEEGIVPESPVHIIGQNSPEVEKLMSASFTPEYNKHGLQEKQRYLKIHAKTVLTDIGSCCAMLSDSPGKKESIVPCQTSPNVTMIFGPSEKITSANKCKVATVQNSPYVNTSTLSEVMQTPLANTANNSSSENWRLESGELPASSLQAPKFKRLRRYRDMEKKPPCRTLEEQYNCCIEKACEPSVQNKSNILGCNKGKTEKAKNFVKSFIEEEAEVSEDAEVSDDEEIKENGDVYDDSFIDDRTNSSEQHTQAENSGEDMLAFYRRSLLTQSPFESPHICLVRSHESVSSRSAESGSFPLDRTVRTPQNLQSGNQSNSRNSVSCPLDSERASLIGEKTSGKKEWFSKLESRKRKLSFQHCASVSVADLWLKLKSELEDTGNAPCLQPTGKAPCHQSSSTEMEADWLSDDAFYQNLDLDAVEAQATELLKCKSDLPMGKMQETFSDHSAQINNHPSANFLSSPSFDLGI